MARRKLSIDVGFPIWRWVYFERRRFPIEVSPSGNQTWCPLWTLHVGPVDVRWLICANDVEYERFERMKQTLTPNPPPRKP